MKKEESFVKLENYLFFTPSLTKTNVSLYQLFLVEKHLNILVKKYIIFSQEYDIINQLWNIIIENDGIHCEKK